MRWCFCVCASRAREREREHAEAPAGGARFVWLSCAASPAHGGKFDAKVVILGAYVVARVLGTLGGTGELTHGLREKRHTAGHRWQPNPSQRRVGAMPESETREIPCTEAAAASDDAIVGYCRSWNEEKGFVLRACSLGMWVGPGELTHGSSAKV